MSLILSGTDGLSDIDGSAATPAIRGTDPNTGMFFPAADTIAFSEGGVEALRLGSAGQIGIGGANYGTAGQVLTSNGASAAPSWQTAAGFASGTRMIFAQTSAPTGWTKDTVNYNNHALRVVTGAASTGGTVDFTTAFASQTPTGSVSTTVDNTTATNQNTTAGGSVSISSISGTVGATTLATSQIPAHSHSGTYGLTGGGWASKSDGGLSNLSTFANGNNTGGGGSHDHSFSFSSGSASFSGSAHSHTQNAHNHTASSSFAGNAINLAVRYLDVITATKD